MMESGNGAKFDPANLKTFPKISAEAFQHPDDRKTTQAIQQLPMFSQMLKAISGGLLERISRLDQIANSFRLSPSQGRNIYALVARAAEILDIDEVPEVYISMGGVNAYASGMKRHTITLLSPLVSMMTQEELLAIIGHELGHIKCAHMVNKTLGAYLTRFGAETIGSLVPVLGPVALQGLLVPLAYWSRMAELSCDRAGLLVVQDPAIVAGALAKIGGWPSANLGQLNLDALEEQLREYEEADQSTLDSLFKIKQLFEQAYSTHPRTAVRILKIMQWGHSDQFKSILDGSYPTEKTVVDASGQVHCLSCGQILAHGEEFCPTCGAQQSLRDGAIRCPNPACGRPITPGHKFCPRCGYNLLQPQAGSQSAQGGVAN